LGLAGIGVAGGLVPSPSALIVLLAAVGLGRAAFGVLLVIAYGLGMAATLTAAGLLLLAVQRRVTRTSGRLSRLATRLPRAAPLVTSGLVVLIGVGLAVRAGAGLI
jgi:ABC-type nickel/cobalt efflux system permease component RcnA